MVMRGKRKERNASGESSRHDGNSIPIGPITQLVASLVIIKEAGRKIIVSCLGGRVVF